LIKTTGDLYHGREEKIQGQEARTKEVNPDRLSLFREQQKSRRKSAFLFCLRVFATMPAFF
jgi:hypothetical protein